MMIPKELYELAQARYLRYLDLPIIREILDRLTKELDPSLCYHNIDHTRDVISETLLFATIDNISDVDCELLAIAAAFHDAGFLTTRVRNEPVGALMAVEAMKKYSQYSVEDQKLVAQMICDTQVNDTFDGSIHTSKTRLSPYLIDGDLSNLGRKDALAKTELIKLELNLFGRQFYQSVLKFFELHTWLSAPANLLRAKVKEDNINELRKLYLEDVSKRPTKHEPDLRDRQLKFIAELGLSLNSNRASKVIVKQALKLIANELQAEAATVYLSTGIAQELEFWALTGEAAALLEGKKIKKDIGVAGWVIDHKQSACIDDVRKDPRFYQKVDDVSQFVTRNVLTTPLLSHGHKVIGAIQILNKQQGSFNDNDVFLLEYIAPQIASSIENARLQERLEQQNSNLEILDKKKKDTLNIIAHEFRTPLNIIQTSAEMISIDDLEDAVRNEMVKALHNGVRRLTNVVQQVLQHGYSDPTEIRVESEAINLKELIEQTEHFFLPYLQARNLDFVKQIETNHLIIHSDRALLRVVINNILSNAIRFTPDQGQITIKVSETIGRLTVTIEDNGIGMTKEIQNLACERIFEAIDSVSHSSGTYEFKSAGLGLGLSTTRSILSALGSNLEIVSEPDKGTRVSFNINLP